MKSQPNTEDTRTIIPVDTLVHLGAGRCSELDEYLALLPRQMLLVEADSQLAKGLLIRIQGLPEVQVNCAAIAGKPGEATLYRYNLPELNSLHPASGLIALFPGLKLVEEQQVETISPVALLEPLHLEAEKENRLVIDLPGEELPVLQALQQSQQLELFSRISLYCGRESLYEGSEPAARILDWLQEVGFDMVAEDDSRDPDRPCWSFRRNALQSRNRDLQQQLDQVLVNNEELTKHVASLQDEIEKLTQNHEIYSKLAGEREAKINELTMQASERKTQLVQQTKVQEQQAKLVADLHTQITQLTQDRGTQSQLAGERETKINELTKQVNDKKTKLDQLEKTQEEQTKLVADLNVQLKQLNQAKTEVEKLAADTKSKLDAISKARDEQTKITTERQEKISQLITTENKQKTLIESQKAEIDKLKTLLHEAKNRSAQLEAQLPEMEHRQQLLNEELIKAEGQIDLIKDLLLREPGI